MKNPTIKTLAKISTPLNELWAQSQFLRRWRAGTLFLFWRKEGVALEAATSFKIIDPSIDPLFNTSVAEGLPTMGWKCWIRGKKYGNFFVLTDEKHSAYEKRKFREILAINAAQSIASICGIDSHDRILKVINEN